MKELYYPPLLDPYVNVMRTEMGLAVLSRLLPIEAKKAISSEQVTDSLLDFVEIVNQNGLDQQIRSFAKTDKPLREEFVIQAVLDRVTKDVDVEGNGRFWFDGDYSLALGYLRGKRAKPLWIGVVSFSLGSDAPDWDSFVKNAGFREPLPVIVQIQGPAHWSYDSDAKYNDAKKILRRLRWTRALVSMVLQWAESAGVPAVYLLPSSLNRFYHDGSLSRDKRLHMRYDVTAKRMGFEQEGPLFRALIDLFPNGDHPLKSQSPHSLTTC